MDKATKALAQKVTALEKLVHELQNAPRKQNEEAVTDPGHAQQHHNEVQSNPPVSPQGNPPDTKGRDSKQKWYNSAQWWKSLRNHPFQWWKERAEIVALVAGIGYAVVTYWQWRDLRHNFQVEQRAWIQLTTPLIPMSEIPTRGLHISVANVGKSVAQQVVSASAIELVKRDDAPLLYARKRHNVTDFNLLFPNTIQGNTEVLFVNEADGALHELTDAEIAGLVAGTFYIAVYGQISYSDNFGIHWTRYCEWKSYSRNPRLVFNAKSCTDWNNVGEGVAPIQ